MSTFENEASNYAFGRFNCDHCYEPAKRFPVAECGHLQMLCHSCSSLGCIGCQRSDSRMGLRAPHSPPKQYVKCPHCPIIGDVANMDKHMKMCETHLRLLQPKLMDYCPPPTSPPLTNIPSDISFTGFGQTPEEPSVNISEIENKIKDMKSEIMKEMRTEFDEKIQEMKTEMDRMKKNEEMNSSALSVLFKKEKERETQWAEQKSKMDQTIDCLSLKLADLETKFNEKGPQQEIVKDRMEHFENLKVENEKMSRENSELKDALKNLKNEFEEAHSPIKSKTDEMMERVLRQEDHSLMQSLKSSNERLNTLLRAYEKLIMENETLITRLRGYEKLKTENEKMSRENSELKNGLKCFRKEFEKVHSKMDQMKEKVLRQEDHYRNERQTLVELHETQLTDLKKENEKMSEEKSELKNKLRKVEDELKRCKEKDEKTPWQIFLPETDINFQGQRNRLAPGPLKSASASTKKKSVQWVPLELSLDHERRSLTDQEWIEMSNNDFKKKYNGRQSISSPRMGDCEENLLWE